MSTPNDPTISHSSLDAIIAAYMEAVEAGDIPNRDDLLAIHAEHAEALQAFFADLDRMDRVASPLRLAGGLDVTSALDANGNSALPTIRYFGDYELLEEIARGGMGIVYKARQVSLNRIVALKMILRGTFATEKDVARFRAEAESAANLDHPHIVPIHEVGEHEGHQYFTMKFVEGTSLAKQRQNDPRKEVEGIIPVIRAVHHAHQRGVLHRDLKPSNVLVDAQGNRFVTDFGLAKRLADADRSLTEPGQILGTPRYMAPEQAAGSKDLTVAADVYSLGVILYERLTGQTPFMGDNALTLLRQARESEPPRPSTIRTGLDRDLETVVLKCLEKGPSRRYSSAIAVADDLDRWRRGEPITARPVGRTERFYRWCRRNRAITAACGLAILSLAGVAATSTFFAIQQAILVQQVRNEEQQTLSALAQAERERDSVRRLSARSVLREGQSFDEKQDPGKGLLYLAQALARAPDADPALQFAIRTNLDDCRQRVAVLTWYSDGSEPLAISSDGKRAFTAKDDGTANLWNVADGSSIDAAIKHADRVWSVAFSPNNETLVTGSKDGTARIWSSTNGTAIGPPMKHDGPVTDVAFSPDGAMVLTGSEDGTVRFWSSVGSLPVGRIIRLEGKVSDVAFSPNGETIVTGHNPNGPGTRVLKCGDGIARLWRVASRSPIGLPMKHFLVQDILFSPNGKTVLTRDTSCARLWNAVDGSPIGAPLGPEPPGGTFVNNVAYSPDGDIALTVDSGNGARLWRAADATLIGGVGLRDSQGSIAAFSPDGSYFLTGDKNGACCLWNTKTRSRMGPTFSYNFEQQFTDFAYTTDGVAFTPDGQSVLTADADNTSRLWRIAGSVAERPQWRCGSRTDDVVEIDADRRTIITLRGTNRPNTARLCSSVARPQAGIALSHEGHVSTIVLSPDGKLLLTANEAGVARLWDSVDGSPIGTPMRHAAIVECVAFRADGRLVLTGSQDKTAQLWNALDGTPIGKPLMHDGPVRSVAFSPDGKTVLTTSGDNRATASGHRKGTIARLWRVAECTQVGRAMSHAEFVSVATLRPMVEPSSQ